MKKEEVLDLINRGIVSAEVLQAAIDIAAIQLKEKEAAEQAAKRFPFLTTIYLHSDDDSLFTHFREAGFSEDEIEKWDLDHIAYEIGLNLQIDADGKVTLLGVTGI